ncbi:MAG TPA: hypothetical protein VIH86_03440 [Puia sp.]
MLTKEFCEFLESKLSKAFADTNNAETKGFWCDGVLLPTFESQYSKKFVNDKRKVSMIAFVGISGQDRYELTLHFGQKSLSKYARDLELTECVPHTENSNWFDIDTNQKKIDIYLG